MVQKFRLADTLSLGDLHTYLRRAGRVEDGSVRLIANSDVLAVYSAILHPRGILDATPTVLGLRTFALAHAETFDIVVALRSLTEGVARSLAEFSPVTSSHPVTVSFPCEVSTPSWVGISPPRVGWRLLGEMDASRLEQAAQQGIHEVADAVPFAVGAPGVQRARSAVWGQGLDDLEYLPRGVAFAALSLGFLGNDPIQLFGAGRWLRVSTRRGHVLARRLESPKS